MVETFPTNYFVNDRKVSIFTPKLIGDIMKCKEFHRIIRQEGWEAIRQRGSHVIYEKDGIRVVVPDHGAKEIPEGLRLKLIKEMGL